LLAFRARRQLSGNEGSFTQPLQIFASDWREKAANNRAFSASAIRVLQF
jgi:hypothetical protein